MRVTGLKGLFPSDWVANVFIPQVRMPSNEVAHHIGAFRIVQYSQLHAGLSKQVLGSEKISVLADDYIRNTEE
jgi:hypothetical protein